MKSYIIINIASVITSDKVTDFLEIEESRIPGIDNYL